MAEANKVVQLKPRATKKAAPKKATAKTPTKKAAAKKAPPKKTTAKKPVAKKAAAKTAVKKTATKPAAKKVAVKKSAAKKSIAKKAVKKTVTKKVINKKAAPKKTVAKKAAPKKAAPKKIATIKANAKKITAKKAVKKAAPKAAPKATVKKAPAQKTTAKRAAPKAAPRPQANISAFPPLNLTPQPQIMKTENIMTQGQAQFDQFTKEAASLNQEGIDAFVKSGTIFAKGFESLIKETINFAQASAEKQMQLAKDAMTSKTINECVDAQNKLAQASFDDFMSGTTKITELGVKVFSEAVEPINDQIQKSVQNSGQSQNN